MFDGGVPEQLRRMIASPPPQPPPPESVAVTRALPFPLSFPSFETTHHFLNSVLGSNNNHNKIVHHHHHHHQDDDIKDGGTSGWMGPTDHDVDGHHHHHHHPWSSDEVLALLRLRSTVENWFPGFTWEHISRKLTEVGFKRSPQECKEKFEEEERRYFNSNTNNDHITDFNTNYKANFRMFSELEEFYNHGHAHGRHHDHHDDDDEHASSEVGHGRNKRQKSLEEPRSTDQEKDNKMGQDLEEEDPREEEELEVGMNPSGNIDDEDDDEKISSPSSSSAMMAMMMMRDEKEKKKRKREKEKEREGFEMLKGFCEGLVRNMIAQQEEMHKKILEDMVKRDEEKIAREEAWKKQETERINKELEIRAHEQALASDRNSTIINFITKFSSLDNKDHHHQHHQQQRHRQHGNKIQSPSTSQSSSSLVLPTKPPISNIIPITLSSSQTLNPQEPISVEALRAKTHVPKPPRSEERCDLGKRWPRDEVLALVNIRCSISSTKINNQNEDQDHNKDGPKAIPLWERISKKMMELGYKRSGKRCKEKWENINKYFRKTKDVNKKRPLDSRTCPYFHQLTALYNTQGSLAPDGKRDSGQDPNTRPDETRVGSFNDDDTHVAANGDDHDEENTVQAPGFDFEF